MANYVQLQIQAEQEAQATVISYADWLVTTMNEALPQNNWTFPSPHPSAISIENVQNLDRDYKALVNPVERYTKCSTACCSKIKPGKQPTCRFHFPKDFQDETSIDFKLFRPTRSKDRELTVEEITRLESKQHLPQSEMIKESTPTTMLCYNTGEPMLIIKLSLTLVH